MKMSAHADEWRPRQAPDLGCPLLAVNYTHRTRTALLLLPLSCCVDMGGAIAFCESRFPEVAHIVTVAGDRVDTCYRRDLAGRWSVSRHGGGFDPWGTSSWDRPAKQDFLVRGFQGGGCYHMSTIDRRKR